MTGRKLLTSAAVMHIKGLYAEKDEWGRHRFSQMSIAKAMGVSETTVYRAIHSGGAYSSLPELATTADVKESLERLKKEYPELVPEGATIVGPADDVPPDPFNDLLKREIQEGADRMLTLQEELAAGGGRPEEPAGTTGKDLLAESAERALKQQESPVAEAAGLTKLAEMANDYGKGDRMVAEIENPMDEGEGQ